MASEVDIANLALVALGVTKRIAAMNESNVEARTLSALYDNERLVVLRDYHWRFATSYVELADPDGEAGDPVNGDWTFAYPYPEDCLKVRRLVSSAGRNDATKIPFALGRDDDGRVIWTDQEDAVAEITFDVDDPTEFDGLFVSALAYRLAAKAAPALSKIKDIAQTCFQLYDYEIAKAKTADENESQHDPALPSEFERARD